MLPFSCATQSGFFLLSFPLFFRLSLKGYQGTAGQQSSLALQGTAFSTRDSDNDNCMCKCAQMLSGGEFMPSRLG